MARNRGPTGRPKAVAQMRDIRKRVIGMVKGFTMIEMMIVVAILALLAAIAIPAFQRYIKSSRAAEAPLCLRQIGHGARLYFYEEHKTTGGVVLPSQFPADVASTPPSPTPPCSNNIMKYRANPAIWALNPTWKSLRFAITNAHYFQYKFTSTGTGTQSKYSSYAYGNLDCDTKTSTYHLRASIDQATGELVALPLLVVNEGE